MLKLRQATVVEADSPDAEEAGSNGRGPASCPEQRLVVQLGEGAAGARRAAIADVALVGRAEVGDEVIVNVQAQALELGSGGFDVVHVNLTRGLAGRSSIGGPSPTGEGESSRARGHVMKLNYTSLQHAVQPVEEEHVALPLLRPVAVLALHGQLASVAWAFAQSAPSLRLGYAQTAGGALPRSPPLT